ncbi:hypothetical protein AVEN_48807-1 [Araneus ventricosus]|uniref:Uncharacterized protein n=1 Tax=Araneus ventricosus TaxID=182803 RepID=A0A4Y2IG98_ARAVE|nr:hypothetical protein AVEN_48807-1 [Araneus ventricosus]
MRESLGETTPAGLKLSTFTFSDAKRSLVTLTSRFEATNFEPRSDDKDDTRAGTPSPNFRTTPAGRRLTTTYDLTCSRPHTRQIFGGIGFEPGTLRPRNRDLYHRSPRPLAGERK